jgi:hypothetical protein
LSSEPEREVTSQGVLLIQGIYDVHLRGFTALDSKVEEIEVEHDTSQDEELICKIFGDLNRDMLGIPGDGTLIILGHSEEEEEGADDVPAKVPP